MGGVSELRAGRLPSEGLLCRSEIEKSAKEMLHRGGWGNPDVLLVQTEAGPVVVKDFSPRSGWVRRWLGPWSLRREEQAYRYLEGLAAVPRLLGRVDELAIILEYRPGVLLSRSLRGTLPAEFLPELQTVAMDLGLHLSMGQLPTGIGIIQDIGMVRSPFVGERLVRFHDRQDGQ